MKANICHTDLNIWGTHVIQHADLEELHSEMITPTLLRKLSAAMERKNSNTKGLNQTNNLYHRLVPSLHRDRKVYDWPCSHLKTHKDPDPYCGNEAADSTH